MSAHTVTVVWEVFTCNNLRMLKFRMGKFSYNNGCSKFERAKRDFRFKILGSTATDHLRDLAVCSSNRSSDFGKGDLSDQADRPWA